VEKKEQRFKVMETHPSVQVFLGKVPVMVRSKFCHLRVLEDQEIIRNAKECTFDQGGYFIINGGEKVIIAQERMANNIVLVFHKKPPSKYSWVAEIRSQAENSNKPPQQFTVALQSKHKGNRAQTISATIPHIRESIPVAILLRALGCLSDKQIINKICYDPKDTDMCEAIRPSLEEAMSIMTEEDALDYISRRGSGTQYSRETRISYA